MSAPTIADRRRSCVAQPAAQRRTDSAIADGRDRRRRAASPSRTAPASTAAMIGSRMPVGDVAERVVGARPSRPGTEQQAAREERRREEQDDEDQREDALHGRGAARAQRERHARSRRTPIAGQRRRSRSTSSTPATPPCDVRAEDQPEHEEVDDLDERDQTAARPAGRGRSRRAGSARRRGGRRSRPRSPARWRCRPTTPPSSSDCVIAAGELEVEEAVRPCGKPGQRPCVR